jgi:hypothetical protein
MLPHFHIPSKALQHIGGKPGEKRLGVPAASSNGQGRLIDISGKNGDGPRILLLPQQIAQQQSKSVGLLACCAASRPEAQEFPTG